MRLENALEKNAAARAVRATSSAPRRILVEPVDQLGPPLGLELQRVEQIVDVLGGLGAALRRQPRRLVQHQRLRILVDHQFARERDLVVAQRRAFGADLGGLDRFLDDFGRRHPQHLPRLQPVARRDARSIDAQLPGARPARDDVEARVGQMPLEPAVQPDAVVVIADRELADVSSGVLMP